MPGPIILRRSGVLPSYPPQKAALQVWLDAAVGTYQDAAMTTAAVADADPIGGWADQSGKGNHATQATAGLRPVLKLAQLNGKPSVLWTAASAQYLSANGAAAAFAGTNIPVTIVAVMKYVTNTGQFSFCLASSGSTNQRGEFYQASTPQYQITLRSDANAQTVTTGGTNPGTNPHVVSYVFDGSNASILQDGTSVAGPTAVTSATYTYNNLTIGGLVSTTPVAGVYLNGHIEEYMMWNVALSTADHRSVRVALGQKYALAVA